MDQQTIEAYATRAQELAAQYEGFVPDKLYACIVKWFVPQGQTADIGCGSGRDAAWLSAQGWPTKAFDASAAMITAARQAHPGLDIALDALPELRTIGDRIFDNILCSAVLMHLPSQELPFALKNLLRIMKPGGRLIASVRASLAPTTREGDGRLYSVIDEQQFPALLQSSGGTLLDVEHQADPVRPEVTWMTFVVSRGG